MRGGRRSGRSESSPSPSRRRCIFGCECGTVFALDQKDGSIEWTVETGGAIKGALAQGRGNVYGGNYAGEFFSIDAETGKVEWRINTIGGSFGRGGGVYSTPAVAFGVYFGSIDSRVYSLDMDTGEIAWSKSTGGGLSGPVVADTRQHSSHGLHRVGRRQLLRARRSHRGHLVAAGHRRRRDRGRPVIGDVAYVSVIGESIGTIGYDIENGKKVYEHELGEYNLAITDGERLYLTGYSTLRAFPPDDGKKNGGKRKGDGGKRKRGGKNQGDGEQA